MTICRYCEHSEGRPSMLRQPVGVSVVNRLHCLHHNATVQPDDTCEAWERAPGADDDLGDDDDVQQVQGNG